jgi:hypothetical protein
MKAVMFGGSAMIIAAGVYMHGGAIGTNVYGMPVEQAYEKLAEMPVPEQLDRFANRSNTSISVSRDPNKSISWLVRKDGEETGGFIAKLESTGPQQTRVHVSFVGSEKFARGSIQDVATKAFEFGIVESVDSTLDGRPYESQKVMEQQMAYVAVNMGAIRESAFKQFEEAEKMHDELRSSE